MSTTPSTDQTDGIDPERIRAAIGHIYALEADALVLATDYYEEWSDTEYAADLVRVKRLEAEDNLVGAMARHLRTTTARAIKAEDELGRVRFGLALLAERLGFSLADLMATNESDSSLCAMFDGLDLDDLGGGS